ncbi:hypothetical protein V1264_005809 [Littorina saxatilis]|uniref:Cytochrome P450 n=2 Tax=Littorina saxatilis TaxID=31220 RepID=A0AAN9B0D0_9CAEN
MSVNCENAGTLTYLDMCISEALRLYPPANILLRQAAEDVELGAYHIPRGWLVLVPVYAIHHNPQLWDQPEMFDPQRFGAEAQSDRHPFSYVPFGSGPRVCIGMRLAQLELRMALAAILKDYAPVLCDKSQYPPRRMKMSPHMSAQDGLWVRFQPRSATL